MKELQDVSGSVQFHTLTPEEALTVLGSSRDGLGEEAIQRKTERYGKNQLKEGKKKSLLAKFLEQFKDVMIIILLVASGIAGFMGEITDTIIILFVVLINATLGVLQESKAEKALEALKKMSAPYVKVKRRGAVQEIKAEDLVPGDIVYLEAGDNISADLRLLESFSLKIEEAALTGESVPSEKHVDAIEQKEVPLGDRKNMAYMGSSVTYGRGIGVVTATGMDTEVGKIAGYLAQQDTEETPLQQKLAELGKYLTVGILVIAVVIFTVGILRDRDPLEMLLTAVSLAVAAIPEGLPAIVTIVLALGVQRMSKSNAIIRKLPAVETLGCTDIICSDKTGTLTQNKMTVKEVYLTESLLPGDALPKDHGDAKMLLEIMVLCNDSKVGNQGGDQPQVIGDPTETALVSYGYTVGYEKPQLDTALPRVSELPFDSERKLMSTLHQDGQGILVLTKGAPDVLLNRCTTMLVNGELRPIDQAALGKIQGANHQMAEKALRVLAMAFKRIPTIPANLNSQELESNLTFVGLVGMIDPPREEVKDAVKVCRQAGIRPIMITGDHRDTATAIAKELNIVSSEKEVMTGAELDKLSDEQLQKVIDQYSVYARVSPEHKVRIVTAWKSRGKVVAMTGDGVNDAPALKMADIGVGMGITGTDVTKSVSDMVLSDDNFSTIVLAIKEGRKIYNNIRKAIQFLLSANIGEVITLFVATMLNWTILLPIHILWINLVTDTFPALALGAEKAETDIMEQPPRDAKSSVFSDGVGFKIVYQGVLEAAITLFTYYLGLKMYAEATAITMAFATLGLIQLCHSFNVRSNTKSAFSKTLPSNPYLIGANLFSGLLLVLVILVPQLNEIFKVQHLTLGQWGIVAIASLSIIPLVELVKLVRRGKAVR